MSLVTRASALAEHLLEPLERRLAHTRAVAGRASALVAVVDKDQQESLIAAAWLHDVGYSPKVLDTGLHPLDGARYLQRLGWSDLIVNAVANHSAARYEAAERGLSAELAAFPFQESAFLDALDTADLTTGPDGQLMRFDERMAEILDRYAPDDPVHRFWMHAQPIEAAAVDRTYTRLANSQPK